jgi:hypothetical protein
MDMRLKDSPRNVNQGNADEIFRRHNCPEPRLVESPEMGPIISIPQVGGLHHRYTRKAA